MSDAKQKIFINYLNIKIDRKILLWLLPDQGLERRRWPIALGIFYIVLIWILGGLRLDHIVIGCLGLLDVYNEKSRLFLKCFLPFILTGIVYDSMRYYYWQGIDGNIHVSEPYFRELSWFGIKNKTMNEYFQQHTWKILDLVCGFAYLVFVAEYLMMAIYLFFKEQIYILKVFGWCFFCVNCLGFITYFIYPAAPPWYISQYGFGPARLDIQPTAAAAQRFDNILGTHFFDEIYGRGIDVFGAYPSLHITYPLLVVWVTFQMKELKFVRAFAVMFFLLMCLSAVYLQHHYITDIIIGAFYVALTLLMVTRCFAWKGIYSNHDKRFGFCDRR